MKAEKISSSLYQNTTQNKCNVCIFSNKLLCLFFHHINDLSKKKESELTKKIEPKNMNITDPKIWIQIDPTLNEFCSTIPQDIFEPNPTNI